MVKFTRFRSIGVAAAAFVAAGALSLAGCSATPSDPPAAPTRPRPPRPAVAGRSPRSARRTRATVCRGLSADIQAGYNAYPYEIQESAWSDWKSEKTDGFTAAIVGQAPAAPFIATYQGTLADSLEACGVDVVLNVAPNDPSDVPGQLQQFGQALSLKPDIIFFNADRTRGGTRSRFASSRCRHPGDLDGVSDRQPVRDHRHLQQQPSGHGRGG